MGKKWFSRTSHRLLYTEAHALFEYWLTKAADTHSECVIPIAFPWIPRKRLDVTFYINIAYLVNAPASTAVQSVKGAHEMLRSAKPSSIPDPVRRHGDK